MKTRKSLFAAVVLALSCAARTPDANAQQASDSDAAFLSALKDISAGVPAATAQLKQRYQRNPESPDQLAASGDENYIVYPEGEGRSKAPSYRIVRKGEAYFIYGNGVASNGGGSVNWRDFQIGVKENVSGNFSVGLVHHNEGHPAGVGHRDGFAALAWYDQPLTDHLRVEAGAGPYFSMNTVVADGQQLDQKKLGLLTAMAFVYRLTNSGLSARAQYNYVKMPGSFDTQTIMVGLNQDLGGDRTEGESADEDSSKNNVSVWGGSAITNRDGQKGHLGYQAEFQHAQNDAVRYSASVIDEGNSTMTNRVGVAGQVWYVAPAAGRFTASVGAGPYVADEREPANHGVKLLGVISLRVEGAVTPKTSCGVRMNRIVSGYNEDEDMFMAGCTHSISLK